MAKSFISGESQKHKCKSLKAGTGPISFTGNESHRLFKNKSPGRLINREANTSRSKDKSKTVNNLNNVLNS